MWLLSSPSWVSPSSSKMQLSTSDHAMEYKYLLFILSCFIIVASIINKFLNGICQKEWKKSFSPMEPTNFICQAGQYEYPLYKSFLCNLIKCLQNIEKIILFKIHCLISWKIKVCKFISKSNSINLGIRTQSQLHLIINVVITSHAVIMDQWLQCFLHCGQNTLIFHEIGNWT